MGSSATGICLPQKSKKRVFPGSSSAMETKADVSSPPDSRMLNRKNKMLKQNDDAMLIMSSRTIDCVEPNKKGKGIIISSTLGDGIDLDSEHGDSDSYNGKDFIDLCSDESASEDEYAILQSHFDNIDLPTGIEASFPQCPDSIKMKNKMTFTTEHSTYPDHATLSFSSVKVPAKLTADLKISAGSSLRLQRGSTRIQTMKKLVKTRLHKRSRGSVGSSSHNGQDQLDHVTNHGEVILMKDRTLDQDLSRNNEEVRKYRNFKKFDMVEDYSDHHYSGASSAMMEPPRNWSKKIQDEWRILEKDLPDMIFVRVYESRMDLLRAVIVGAKGTPYHDGLFFFDVCFPKNYPFEPPQVHYHSGGLRINPNLYKCGKVCLSLLNTWPGAKNEHWTPGVSTMLQVLVSIQGLILNAKPYFNEPGYERSSGSVSGENRSLLYNERTLILSLKTMVYTMNKPPKHFEDLVIGHFLDRGHDILTTCKAYMKGTKVGCGEGEGEATGSRQFKNDLGGYMKTLVEAFTHIGVVENLEEFIPPTQNRTQNLTQKIRSFLGI